MHRDALVYLRNRQSKVAGTPGAPPVMREINAPVGASGHLVGITWAERYGVPVHVDVLCGVPEGQSTILRQEGPNSSDPDPIGVAWVHREREVIFGLRSKGRWIGAAVGDHTGCGEARPLQSRIVPPEDAQVLASLQIPDKREDHTRRSGRRGEFHTRERCTAREGSRQRCPSDPSVHRPPQGGARIRVSLQDRGKEDARARGIGNHRSREAGDPLRPPRSTVHRRIHAAVSRRQHGGAQIRPCGSFVDRHVKGEGVEQGGGLWRGPRVAAVGRAQHAAPGLHETPSIPGAGVDDARIHGVNDHRSDGRRALLVGERGPRRCAGRRAPHASLRSEQHRAAVGGMKGNRVHASRLHLAAVHAAERLLVDEQSGWPQRAPARVRQRAVRGVRHRRHLLPGPVERTSGNLAGGVGSLGHIGALQRRSSLPILPALGDGGRREEQREDEGADDCRSARDHALHGITFSMTELLVWPPVSTVTA